MLVLQLADLQQALKNIDRPELADAIGERFQNQEQLTVDNLPTKTVKESTASKDSVASKAASAA
jgi:hypothetical protein